MFVHSSEGASRFILPTPSGQGRWRLLGQRLAVVVDDDEEAAPAADTAVPFVVLVILHVGESVDGQVENYCVRFYQR